MNNMNESIENIKEWIELIENVIYTDSNCPTSFEKEFCDGNELTGVSFNSENMIVNYIISSGQHIVNSFKLIELNKWLENDDA